MNTACYYHERMGKINNVTRDYLQGGNALGKYRCYYCEHATDSVHQISFFQGKQDRDELLCDDCYADWIESLKSEP